MYDICIIGSGAGGAPIAYELSRAGYRVVVLEKGQYFREEDMDKDELAVCRRERFTPKLEDEYHIIKERQKDGSIKIYDGREYNWSFWNGTLVGGSSNLMSGYFHSLEPQDFKLLSTYGEIEGANVVDWVIDYKELEPYYKKVTEVVGVSGKDMPYPPLKTNRVTGWFDKVCSELGYNSYETPRAILSQNALGRAGCYYSNFCGSYGCASGAKGSARASLLQKCNATIITETFVYRLESSATRVTKALYYDKAKKSHEIKAKIFVLSAQAIESSRLLLNSKNQFFPNGLANNSNQVGKNLLFSAGGSGQGRFVFEKLTKQQQRELMEVGLFFNRSLKDWYEFKSGKKLQKGGVIDFLFEHQNIIPRIMREVYKDGELLWGDKLAKKIEEHIKRARVLTFEVFNDWLPTDGCFVSVDEKNRDFYGVPVGVINLNSHPKDLEVGEFLAKKALNVLKKLGCKDISYSISASPPPNLQAGGCRFGNNPKTSVLDKNCKTWELENLYVTDGSFMPTGGSVPYTWTIYANSFRVANYIIKNI